jgi:thiol:disulfide interchange protein DsbD
MRQLSRLNLLKSGPVLLIGFLALAGVRPTGVLFAADAPKPAKKDSRLGIKPKTAELTALVTPAQARPGDIVTFHVTAKLEPGYHIYKHAKEEGGAGPVNTTFDFFDTAGLKIDGDWSASKPPEKHKDPNFADVEFVEYFEDEVTWSIKLKVPAGMEPGKRVLRCQAGYMVCDAKNCSIPGRWTLPDVELTIAGGNATSWAGDGDGQASAVLTAGKLAPGSAPNASAAPSPKGGAGPPQAVASDDSATAPSRADVTQAVKPESSASIATARSSSPEPSVSSEPGALGSSPPGAGAPLVQSEIAQEAQRGLIPFLIASALGGLFALVMPCVWPMIPITVNFFVKQGQGPEGRSKSTRLAIIYCLSIIAVFTAVGVLFAFFFSAAFLQNLANNFWINLLVAALFVIFGLSLLGMFELRLPSFLLNASAQGESRGGVIGVVFMALTLTITSFTCTFPVVGGLLVMAAGGSFLYPILGLATFAAVVAFPFFLLALSPGLIARMPRSGDWMNAVKVVGGLVEIGAALKFLNAAELAYVTAENAWFDARVVLTSWVVLSAVCGLYLLGIFRTDHDHDEVKVGPGRLLFGSTFLALALFMAPALFGRVPQSVVWNRLVVGLLPPDANKLGPNVRLAGGASDPAQSEVKASSTDPALAERQERRFHGVVWGMSYDQALEVAAAENKPVLIDFTGVNCANCRAMESGVFPLPEVVAVLKRFVTVQLYTDRVQIDSITPQQRAELAEINQDRLLKLAHEQTNPIYVVLSPTGKLLSRIGGYNEPKVFVEFLTGALKKLPQSGETTRVTSAAGNESRGTTLATVGGIGR